MALLAGGARPCLAWGTVGHTWVVNEAISLLPDTAARYMKDYYKRYINYRVMEPDWRKERDESEAPKHFFDLESYVRSGLRVQDWPWTRQVVVQKIGVRNFAEFGQGPWALAETSEQAVAALCAHDWQRARVLLVNLSHYVGDLNQPLHCTSNFNGWETGNGGVHMRFEKELLQRYSYKIPHAAGTPRLISDAVMFNFAMVKASNARVAAVMAADRKAGWEPEINDRAYYDKFWREVRPVLMESLHAGALNLACYYLTVITAAQQAGAFSALAADSAALVNDNDTGVNFEPADADQDRGYAGRQRNRRDRNQRDARREEVPPSPGEQTTRRYLIIAGALVGLGGLAGFIYTARRRRHDEPAGPDKHRANRDDQHGGHDVFGGD